ncbi:MAG: SDR family NAD(P)-dependent oxidoreductase, partial [Clostridia bacterium]|nr:SDR family NAD(P)-dependent oxidoreductase [Clostridia bacterium]
MKEVCVITGGGSGMGLATAKYIKDRLVIISGRTESKLAAACEELKAAGVEAIYKTCDTSSRASVAELAKFASEQGTIKQVINCAGMSPAMTNAEKLFRINAMGTVYVNEEFQKYMDRGSVICDVASNSAYALPGFMTKAVKFAYKWADKDEDKFVNFFMKLAGKISDDY